MHYDEARYRHIVFVIQCVDYNSRIDSKIGNNVNPMRATGVKTDQLAF